MVQRFQMIEMVMLVMRGPLIFLVILSMTPGLANEARGVEPHREGSHVAVAGDAEAGYRLLRNGEPFVIRGAGGEGSLETLAACGGNEDEAEKEPSRVAHATSCLRAARG
jgi:hypothetical protein